MPESFAHDPAAIRAYAEVFARASSQLAEVRATLGDTSASATDFGNAWAGRGADFEIHLAALADDLANLGKCMGEVGTRLSKGTGLTVEADTAGLRDVRASGSGSQ